jgi:hypothetical protein
LVFALSDIAAGERNAYRSIFMRRCAENHCVAASDASVYIEVPSDIGPLGGINAREVAENGNAAHSSIHLLLVFYC